MKRFNDRLWMLLGVVALGAVVAQPARGESPLNQPPAGFSALFNGKDLEGWKGLVGDPLARAKMSPEQLAEAQKQADAAVRDHFKVENGQIVCDGKGPNLCTTRPYGDFEMWVDWKIPPRGDSGIYLRGSPQVQIWDPQNPNEKGNGADKGSGGLWNNTGAGRFPLVKADNPLGEWNTFHIRMVGSLVRVELNGKLTVDDAPMENYWDRKRPIFPAEQIELQTHGGEIRFRNIYLREIAAEEANGILRKIDTEGFKPLFNGKDLDGWVGATAGYMVNPAGNIQCKPGAGGNLMTKDEYENFEFRFEFKLPPGGNNGIGIRAPIEGDAAYQGMEIQVLDDTAKQYEKLQPYQFHGSIYGVEPAQRGYLRPTGQWNFERIVADGPHIQVWVNGTKTVDADVSKIDKTMDGGNHPGLHNAKGHVGFLGHNDPVEFRAVEIRGK